ncbi:unnamed protein product, partial [Adineta steineri]
MLAPPPRR